MYCAVGFIHGCMMMNHGIYCTLSASWLVPTTAADDERDFSSGYSSHQPRRRILKNVAEFSSNIIVIIRLKAIRNIAICQLWHAHSNY